MDFLGLLTRLPVVVSTYLPFTPGGRQKLFSSLVYGGNCGLETFTLDLAQTIHLTNKGWVGGSNLELSAQEAEAG